MLFFLRLLRLTSIPTVYFYFCCFHFPIFFSLSLSRFRLLGNWQVAEVLVCHRHRHKFKIQMCGIWSMSAYAIQVDMWAIRMPSMRMQWQSIHLHRIWRWQRHKCLTAYRNVNDKSFSMYSIETKRSGSGMALGLCKYLFRCLFPFSAHPIGATKSMQLISHERFHLKSIQDAVATDVAHIPRMDPCYSMLLLWILDVPPNQRLF